MLKIIMDVDTGGDDAVAIILAIISKKFDVVGICTETLLPINVTTDNTLKVLNLLKKKIPVYKGSECALVKTLSPLRKRKMIFNTPMTVGNKTISMHMPFDLPLGKEKAENKDAASFLVDFLRNSEEKITIVMTGPGTNLALALCMDDTIVEKIEQLIIMGGGYQISNVTKAAESNFFRDPEAAQTVLSCGVPIVLFPLDATHQASFSKDDIEKLRSINSKISNFICSICDERMIVYNKTQPIESKDGMLVPIHDALTIAYLIDEDIVEEFRSCNCEVECSQSVGDGKMIVDNRFYDDKHNVKLALKINRKKYVEMIYDNLCKWSKLNEKKSNF